MSNGGFKSTSITTPSHVSETVLGVPPPFSDSRLIPNCAPILSFPFHTPQGHNNPAANTSPLRLGSEVTYLSSDTGAITRAWVSQRPKWIIRRDRRCGGNSRDEDRCPQARTKNDVGDSSSYQLFRRLTGHSSIHFGIYHGDVHPPVSRI
jgi:hypothetical protein